MTDQSKSSIPDSSVITTDKTIEWHNKDDTNNWKKTREQTNIVLGPLLLGLLNQFITKLRKKKTEVLLIGSKNLEWIFSLVYVASQEFWGDIW